MKRFYLSKILDIFPALFFVVFVGRLAEGGSDITGEIFGFIDANYDRYTDLLVRRGRNNLTVYLASKKEDASFSESSNFAVNWTWPSELIVNVGVGDFNGDSYPDLLITSVSVEDSKSERNFNVSICYNDQGVRFHACNRTANFLALKEQPLILNCDQDQISDFFTVTSNGTKVCYLGNRASRDLEEISVFTNSNITYPNGYHGFADLTGDLNADVVLMTSSSDKSTVGFEIWERHFDDKIKSWKWSLSGRENRIPGVPFKQALLKTTENRKVGHVILDDFNRDGRIDILLPFCENQCNSLNFALGYFDAKLNAWQWELMDVPLNGTSSSTVFSVDLVSRDYDSPFVIRSGDYTQNGFPDLLIVLNEKNSKDSERFVNRGAFFIENVGCYEAGFKCDFGRQFRLSWQPVAPCTQSFYVNTAAFFDLNEDGTMDVLYECVNEIDSHDNSVTSTSSVSKIAFSASLYSGDTTFLKVQAYTTTCSACDNGKEGTGISLHGASFWYVMTDADGNEITSSYSQQSSTTYRSLLLPYALFGLGRSPNFVDKLRLGIPATLPEAMHQTWQQIVPNSRMYVIPYPPDQPSHWIGRLYVTPSRLILMSLAALGGVCSIILLAIIVLHWIESRADRKEREIQKKHFHFDAM